jgi:type I restriction enzyme M protein
LSVRAGRLAEVPLRGFTGRRGARGRLFAGPSGSLIRADDYVPDEVGGVPVVMPRDLVGGIISEAAVKRVPYPPAEGLARFHLQPGDVVLARRGELGRCAVVRPEQAGWVCGTGCFVLRPPAELDADRASGQAPCTPSNEVVRDSG